MKVSLVLSGLCMIAAAGSAFAQDVPDVVIAVDPDPILVTCEPLVDPVSVGFSPVGFGDVHATIAAMRALLAEPGAMVQANAISAAADAFAQHWDMNIADHVAQQDLSATTMIDDMLEQNDEAIDAFLTNPPMDPGPSLFDGHEFQVAVAPIEHIGGFFAP